MYNYIYIYNNRIYENFFIIGFRKKKCNMKWKKGNKL